MSFVFYDTETTGVETGFDQVLQLAAIRTDDKLQELDTINLRCRRLPFIVPSPGALLVTGIPLDVLEGENRTHYQMFLEVEDWFYERSPTVFMGYNNMRFDEVLLRQAFYQTLQPIYLTNTHDNCRADLMLIAHAAAVYASKKLTFPKDSDGRYVFRLGDIVRANGIDFSEEDAHDALADVRATIDFARLVRAAASDVWNAMIRNAQKRIVNAFIEDTPVFYLTNFFFGYPYTNIVTKAGTNTENNSEIAVFDLTHDPREFLDLDVGQLLDEVLNRSPKIIRTVRTNAQPIVMPLEFIPEEIRGDRQDDATYHARAEMIRANRDFQGRLGQALARRYEDVEPSPFVEGKIYDGFPTNEDAGIMERFHDTPWQERFALCDQFEDERFKELGRRLIYLEQPDFVPRSELRRFNQWVAQRMLTEDDVPWTTIPKALQEVDDLRGQHPEMADRLNEIRTFLLELADRYADG